MEGLNFFEIFSLGIKSGSARIPLTIATMHDWDILPLDVKNTFLHDYLQELVFMEQSPGFIDPYRPNHICC